MLDLSLLTIEDMKFITSKHRACLLHADRMREDEPLVWKSFSNSDMYSSIMSMWLEESHHPQLSPYPAKYLKQVIPDCDMVDCACRIGDYCGHYTEGVK